MKVSIEIIIGAFVSFVSAIIGALVGGYMSRKASLEATEQAHKNTIELQEKERKQTIKSLLRAIFDEITTLWERYMWSIGEELEKLPKGKPLLLYYPITQEYFTIYNSNASLIGSIQDSYLRSYIVKTYYKAKSLIDSYRMNNDYLRIYENYEMLGMQTQNHFFQFQAAVYLNLMGQYVEKIKKTHYEIKEDVSKLLRLIEKEINP